MEKQQHSSRPLKRQRVDSDDGVGTVVVRQEQLSEEQKLIEVSRRTIHSIYDQDWKDVMECLELYPQQVEQYSDEPSMLALACRSGAPYVVIKRIVDLSPTKLRHLLDARGTPLHEAIVCDEIGPNAVGYLLQMDEQLDHIEERKEGGENDDKGIRAALMQDVDGYTPLHLLIRRRFQSYVLDQGVNSISNNNDNNNGNSNSNETGPDNDTNNDNSNNNNPVRNNFMEILELLVRSCPEATCISDRGEYEEPPIVMALKANVYAPLLQQPDAGAVGGGPGAGAVVGGGGGGNVVETPETTTARIERYIFEMVQCMLRSYPQAASCMFNGYRGQYTAVHSAVFHGRSPETIELLLNAEKEAPSAQPACLLGNTQGELPLHFCAMRGEPPRTVALLAKAAPEAISKRDASGLTPIHWLWIRYVSTLLAVDDGRDSPIVVPLRATCPEHASVWEQDNFEANLELLRRVDPSVDFLRMRHIPTEVQDDQLALPWTERTVELLMGIRRRIEQARNDDPSAASTTITLSRIEAIAALFWTKLVSLLLTVGRVKDSLPNSDGEFISLIKAAFINTCCPPLATRIVALVFSDYLNRPDVDNRIALHHAAMRPWHAWELPRVDGTSDAASSKLLRLESIVLLKVAESVSQPESANHKDKNGCLPLHHLISSCIRACCNSRMITSGDPVQKMIDSIGSFVKMNPSSLHTPDPRSGLIPYMHASALACKTIPDDSGNSSPSSFPDEKALSIVYSLLREDPSLIESNEQN